MKTNRLLRAGGLLSCALALGACASVADFRDLERKVAAIDRRSQGPTDQQSRLAELGAELDELKGSVAQLRGSLEELKFSVEQLNAARGEQRPGGAGAASGSTGGGPGGPAGPVETS